MDYSNLVAIYAELEGTQSRLEKTYIVYKMLSKCEHNDLKQVLYLLQGKIFPNKDPRETGVSSKLIIKAIAQATGAQITTIEKHWSEKGDLGLVAESLIKNKKQTTLYSNKLTVTKIFLNLQALALLEGKGSISKKLSLVAELLTSASPLESKFIVRTILGQLRVGIAEGVLRDAITWVYFPKVIGIFYICDHCKSVIPNVKTCINCHHSIIPDFKLEVSKHLKKALKVSSMADIINVKSTIKNYDFIIAKDEKTAREIFNYFIESVQEIYDVCNDFFSVVEALQKNTDISIDIKPGNPINPMLAIKLESMTDMFEAIGKPVLAEYKLDGFRLQIHRNNDKYWFFTRRLENVFNQFKELVPVIKQNIKGRSFILDCEIVGFDLKTRKYFPFQSISQRIKRKYDIEKTAKQIPVEINVFDILHLNGSNLIRLSQEKRRKIIEKIVKNVPGKIKTTEYIISESQSDIEKFYKKSLEMGNEGIMLKNLHKKYTPGRRVGGWLKFKPNLEPLDLVIVGATYGEGKRASYLSSYILACKSNSNFLECGMSSSGLKEKKEEGLSYKEMTEMLNPLILTKKGRKVTVRPKIIVEVMYEEIQKSPTYSSGFALRFPRIKNIRHDKPLKDIATIKEIVSIFQHQRQRVSKH